MKTYQSLIQPNLAFLIAFVHLAATSFAEMIPPAVEQLGPIALKKFLPSLDTPGVRAGFGFDPADNLQSVTLGKPFQILVLLPDTIRKYRSGDDFQHDLVPENNWFFPVLSHARPTCLMSVAKQPDGSWVGDQFGMTRRGQAWAAMSAAWPSSKGFTPLLIQSINPGLLMFSIPQFSFPNLTPIDLNRDPAQADYKNLKRADDTFAELKNNISMNRY